MRADLTGRYTNNEIKKTTREKIVTLIEDLQGMNENPQTGMRKKGGHVEAIMTQLPQCMKILVS